MTATIPERAAGYGDRIALISESETTTYRALDQASAQGAAWLLAGRSDLEEARVAYLLPPGVDHVVTQWAIWRAGGIAVPLAISHPAAELDHVIRDSGATIVIASRDRENSLAPLAVSSGARFGTPEDLASTERVPMPRLDGSRRATIIYTSGTTERPKGVVATHRNLVAQLEALASAWAWTPDDRILLVLPLHHVHGIVNVLGSALWNGARCEVPPRFEPEQTWNRLGSGELTLFMAVPTIYRRLIAAWEAAGTVDRERWSAGCRRLRLMVSGSAALPVQTLEHWREITGHTLLERYGMTEIGMALSNPLVGERRPGFVGTPLPGVRVRLVDEHGDAGSGGYGRGTGSARPIRVRGILEPSGWHPRGVPGRLVPDRRRGGDGEWHVSIAGTHQHRHHQDRRLQSLGARGRGGPANPSSCGGMRRGGERRCRVGRTSLRCGGAQAESRAFAGGASELGPLPARALQVAP